MEDANEPVHRNYQLITQRHAFVFERVRVKVGPLEIGLGGDSSTKDPFFVWFYVDEEIAVAQGKGGGTAFWCRCKRVPT
jgi:hypothetical protein